jgi:hypothetical protein
MLINLIVLRNIFKVDLKMLGYSYS